MTLELQLNAEQTAFNLRRWAELLANPELRKIEGRVETDRFGRVIMSPPPAPRHGRYQYKIGSLLEKLMRSGEVVTECPISTADGVKGADVVWASAECWNEAKSASCFLRAPEICVEVVSPDTTAEEIREKAILYLDAGATEVWVCGMFGAMAFYGAGFEALSVSKLCPNFPRQI